jgi:hypothetical protein
MLTVAYGSSVTVVPRTSATDPGVQFKTQYGYLNATLAESFNSFTVYANGTVYFDLGGRTAPQQGKYVFQTLSYGNGTMQLRFAGPQPYSVTQTASSSVYSNNAQWQQLTYTNNQASILILIYNGPAIARSSFTLAAIILFSFLSLFFPLTFMKWLIEGQMGQGEPIVNMLRNKKRFVILLIAVTIVGIIGVITILLEPLLG